MERRNSTGRDLFFDFFYIHPSLPISRAVHKRLTSSDRDGQLEYIKGDSIEVPKTTMQNQWPRHIGLNVRTQKRGHFSRAMLSKVYLTSNAYPKFL